MELGMFTQGVYKSSPQDYSKPHESIPHFYVLMIIVITILTLPFEQSTWSPPFKHSNENFVCISDISDALLDTFAKLRKETSFSSCLSVRMYPPDLHWADFLEILCLVFALNSFDRIHVWLKSDKSNSSGRPVCVYCSSSLLAFIIQTQRSLPGMPKKHFL
jgi:hypothetical protein